MQTSAKKPSAPEKKPPPPPSTTRRAPAPKRNVAAADIIRRAKESGLGRTDEEVLDVAAAALQSLIRPTPPAARAGVVPPTAPVRTAYELALGDAPGSHSRGR